MGIFRWKATDECVLELALQADADVQLIICPILFFFCLFAKKTNKQQTSKPSRSMLACSPHSTVTAEMYLLLFKAAVTELTLSKPLRDVRCIMTSSDGLLGLYLALVGSSYVHPPRAPSSGPPHQARPGLILLSCGLSHCLADGLTGCF